MTSDSAGSSSAPLWPQPMSSVGGRQILSDHAAEAEMHDSYSNAYKNSPTEGIYVAPPLDEQSAWLHKLNKYRCPDERLSGRAPEENVRPTKRTKLDDSSSDLKNNSTPIRGEEDPKSWNEGVSKSWPGRKRKDAPGYLSAEVVRDRYLSTVSTFARLSNILSDRRRSKGRIDARIERLKQELNHLEAAFLVEKARLEQDGRLPIQSHREARNGATEVITCHRKDLARPRSDENSLQHPGRPFEVLANDAVIRTLPTPSSKPNAVSGVANAAVPTALEPLATSSAVSVTRLGPGLVLPVAEQATSGTRNDPDEGCFQNQAGRSVFLEGPEDDDDDDDDNLAYRQLRRFLTYQPLCSTNLPAKDARGTLWDNAESNFESCSNFERSHAVTPEDRTCRQVASGCRLQFSCSNVGTGSDRLPSVSVHTRTKGATEVATCCNNRRIFAATTGSRTASRDASVLGALERKESGSIWRAPRPENSWTFPFFPSTCCSIGASSSNLGHVTPTAPIFDDVTTNRDLSDISAPNLSHLPLPLPLPLPPPAHPQVGMPVGLTLSDSSLSSGLPCGAVDGSLADVCYAGRRRWGCTAEAPQSPARYPHLMLPAAAAAVADNMAPTDHPGIRQLQRPRNLALDEGGGRWLCG